MWLKGSGVTLRPRQARMALPGGITKVGPAEPAGEPGHRRPDHVHEGHWFEQVQRLAAPCRPGEHRLALARPALVQYPHQVVEDALAEVVTGVPVLLAGIP